MGQLVLPVVVQISGDQIKPSARLFRPSTTANLQLILAVSSCTSTTLPVLICCTLLPVVPLTPKSIPPKICPEHQFWQKNGPQINFSAQNLSPVLILAAKLVPLTKNSPPCKTESLHPASACGMPGLKVGQMIQTIWVTYVTFLVGQVGLICKLNYLDVTRILHVLEKTVLASGK